MKYNDGGIKWDASNQRNPQCFGRDVNELGFNRNEVNYNEGTINRMEVLLQQSSLMRLSCMAWVIDNGRSP